jgi:hypothetical protein
MFRDGIIEIMHHDCDLNYHNKLITLIVVIVVIVVSEGLRSPNWDLKDEVNFYLLLFSLY